MAPSMLNSSAPLASQMDAATVKADADETRKGHGEHDQLREPLALSRAAAVMVETLRQRLTAPSLRSLCSCFGLSETAPFNLPQQHHMLARMKTNGNYFFTNYLLATAVVFAFLLLFFHPIQLLICIIVAYGWHVFLTRRQLPTDQFIVFGRRLGEQDILLIATASTVVFLLFFILPTVILSLSVSSLGSAVHALLRDTRLKDDAIGTQQNPNEATEADQLV